ncbi:hypothetical protein VKT23_016566 [Stygiomarasmius scandens]|uniref:Uncharacterized protein n=1 Tax=Marasmiellus scandens TaxID=2682957 RepID=A0ABR1IX46_9AGAR
MQAYTWILVNARLCPPPCPQLSPQHHTSTFISSPSTYTPYDSAFSINPLSVLLNPQPPSQLKHFRVSLTCSLSLGCADTAYLHTSNPMTNSASSRHQTDAHDSPLPSTTLYSKPQWKRPGRVLQSFAGMKWMERFIRCVYSLLSLAYNC